LLPARLAYYGGQIIPKKYFEQLGADEFNLKPVGSGPIKFVSWVKDQELVFEPYKDYWGGRIAFDKVVYRPIPETAARVAALQRGEVDLIFKLPPDQVAKVNQFPNAKAKGDLYAGLYVLALNSKNPPLDNPKVKQALSY